MGQNNQIIIYFKQNLLNKQANKNLHKAQIKLCHQAHQQIQIEKQKQIKKQQQIYQVYLILKISKKLQKQKNLNNQKKKDTKYNIIQEVCKNKFQWNISLNKNIQDWNIIWYDYYINDDKLRKMLPFQKINHFPGSYNLGKKNYLGKHLQKMNKIFPLEYDFFPKTWLLPFQYEELRIYMEKNKTKKPVIIVKPEANCQGKGIYLIQSIQKIRQEQHVVAQQYIQNPYLIDGLKFDFRVYALVKSVCPLKIFLYREGFARFATVKYQKPQKKNIKNMWMHLTNYAINKLNPEFIFNKEVLKDDFGHKRSFSSILKYLSEIGEDINKVLIQIKQIINKTMCSVQPYLSHLYKSSQLKEQNNCMCFEIFGFQQITKIIILINIFLKL
ncbi:tubulin-tyrosine ligase family protein, putative [Ichthyophthirius multifiliis]|uniref:Tubulin-tyrosine ligase family protein, putative n=1 Tax=Ichthyophthirius multifiliis TaxID=5932 RepID=G0R639_ICHMU|nr:tubulin-tyrosine ligase family protein, putative [Ichthyophthirius multifiliis]EGR27062.1 tubulin-tyrosine ligase family protein, putative [Ichthyophthirius multifiliis]|eukprot:XP_004023946.1 tubulin-tyrosine ligase family protein, putative [Ichthyophthirius multifiliis]